MKSVPWSIMPIRHEIRQGETVISLSEIYGFFAETIWNDPANAQLKEKRRDMNILMPGDIVVIPDKLPKEVNRETNNVHKFQRKGIPAVFRLQMFEMEEVRANQKYCLTVDGRQFNGQTDSRGVLQEFIPTDSKKGLLIIGPDEYCLEIDFGYLDPINEISGVKKRLNNLGYDCGETGNKIDDNMQSQLKLFQKRFGLEETGEADSATVKKLEELHDTPKEFPPVPTEASDGGF